MLAENNVYEAWPGPGSCKDAIAIGGYDNPETGQHRGEGLVRASGNMALNGAQVREREPRKVFDPANPAQADAYYAFSLVFFYTNQTALLLNGRRDNLEYGSYAPGAPQVFINDEQFKALWSQPTRWYLLVYGSDMPRLARIVPRLHIVARNADNYLLTNLALHE